MEKAYYRSFLARSLAGSSGNQVLVVHKLKKNTETQMITGLSLFTRSPSLEGRPSHIDAVGGRTKGAEPLCEFQTTHYEAKSVKNTPKQSLPLLSQDTSVWYCKNSVLRLHLKAQCVCLSGI